MLSQAILELKDSLEESGITTNEDIPTLGLTKGQLEKISTGPLAGLVYYSKDDDCYVGLGFYWITVERN